MTDRTATAAIAGYYYQFDKTILEILNLSKNDFLTVEGIEDIDVKTATSTNAIQCKYLTSKTFTNSTIRNPLILMLSDYINRPVKINYTLYLYVSDKPASSPIIDLTRFKEILTFKEKKKEIVYYTKNNISDVTLNGFLSNLKVLIGSSIEEQRKEVLEKLKTEFNCKDAESDFFYYNASIRQILQLSTSDKIENRTITKKSFISSIDKKDIIFNEWYLAIKGKTEYLAMLKKTLHSEKALQTTKDKCIFIDVDFLTKVHNKTTLLSFIKNLVSASFEIGTTLYNALPYSLVIKDSHENYIQLKKDLLGKNIIFNDAFEGIEFNVSNFIQRPLIERKQIKHKLSDRISKSSFRVKLISSSTQQNNISKLTHYDTILFVSDQDPALFFKLNSAQHYQITSVQNLTDLLSILE